MAHFSVQTQPISSTADPSDSRRHSCFRITTKRHLRASVREPQHGLAPWALTPYVTECRSLRGCATNSPSQAITSCFKTQSWTKLVRISATDHAEDTVCMRGEPVTTGCQPSATGGGLTPQCRPRATGA